jgi:hypothetical protein
MSTPSDGGKINGPLPGAVEPADKPLAGYVVESSATLDKHATQRVRVYVDGFNLYYGLHQKYGRKYLWLDLRSLAASFLRTCQVLTGVEYFTARRRRAVLSQANQATYLGALKARGVKVIEGRFQEKSLECNSCGATWTSYEEKESDVSFCVRLLEDAVARKFDVALLITADSDMMPAVKAVRRLRPEAKLVALFPPARYSDDLKRAVHAHFRIGEARLRQAQMPDTVYTPAASYSRPVHWK